jgi:hypothetical protein
MGSLTKNEEIQFRMDSILYLSEVAFGGSVSGSGDRLSLSWMKAREVIISN